MDNLYHLDVNVYVITPTLICQSDQKDLLKQIKADRNLDEILKN